jgi:predicted phage terminase large subunit-like protein
MKRPEKIQARIEPRYEPLLFPRRYKVLYGGRGGGKSWGIARILVSLAYAKPLRVLCCREIQDSIAESVKKLLDDEISRLGLKWFYRSTKTAIYGLNGTEIIFGGLRYNYESIKSMEGIDLVWVEEAQTISRESLDTLIPTIRNAGSEIWFSLNPRNKADPVYADYVLAERPDTLKIRVNYYDNPHLPDELLCEARICKAMYPQRYRHIWLGEPCESEGQILNPDWWCYYESRSEIAQRVSATIVCADTAYKAKQGNDYSVIQRWGVEGTRRAYLLDQWRARAEFPDLLLSAKRLWNSWRNDKQFPRPRTMFIEDKASGQSLVQTLRRQGVVATPWKPEDYSFPADKAGRARECAWLAYGECLWLPDNQPWTDEFVDECSDFRDDDSHPFDDQVDGMGIGLSVWRRMGGGRHLGNVAP